MAYINFQPSDFFNTILYDGNGSTNARTGLGFQPDWVWIKNNTNDHDHYVFDSVRGVTKHIRPNTSDPEGTASGVTSFDSDGFTLGNSDGMNENGRNFVAWNWKAGTTSGITTNGTTVITPSAYSFDQSRGFSMVKFTGNGSDGTYLAHGLGKVPELLFHKSTSLSGESWQIYSAASGNQGRGFLNLSSAFNTGTGEWASTTPDNVNMRLSNDTHINSNGATYMQYYFASIKGYSKISSWTGGGSNFPFIYTGFKPAFIISKNTQRNENWLIHDNKRNTGNINSTKLSPNDSSAQSTNAAYGLDFLSNGFKIRTSDTALNQSGEVYLYMAIAEHPLVASNGDPATAR